MAPLLSLLCLIPLLVDFLPSAAQTNNSTGISTGSTLTASVSVGSTTTLNSWASPSGDFAFGFYPLVAAGENSTTVFLLAIWFANLPNQTIVWWGNDGNTVQAGSKLELSTNGQLVLYDHQENETWRRPQSAAGSNSSAAASAAMLDTGNFVIRGSQRSGNNSFTWSSFDEPTNTILPSQVLELSGKLSSRRSDKNRSDFTRRGRFELRMLPDGNLVLNTIALPTIRAYEAYYVSDTASRSGKRLVFNSSGDIYIALSEGSLTVLTSGSASSSTRDFYHRATLDSDGVFRHYVIPKTGTSMEWSAIGYIAHTTGVSSVCYMPGVSTGSGICGFNSLCVPGEEDGRYRCECPTGYAPMISAADGSTTCKPIIAVEACGLDISRAGDLFDMETMENTNWPNFDYERINDITDQQCLDSCRRDCLCNVAVSNNNNVCWKKKLPMSSGRQGPGEDGKAFIKIWKVGRNISTGPTTSSGRSDGVTGPLLVWGSVLLGTSYFLTLFFLVAAMVAYHFSIHKKLLSPMDLIVGKNIRIFTYGELVKITGGFKEELGRGAYGTVYKGSIHSKEDSTVSTFVAVKKLEAEPMRDRSDKEVRTEVTTIGRTHHKNLVRLLGFCDDAPHRLLVYEFINNGTLASYLFHRESKPRWSERLRIASGIASGLAYLHDECISKIIHCDVKPENVLLDDNFNPKISDFELAKLMRANQSRTSTGFRGTRGYVAPEWYRKMPVSVKVDVHSFGIKLLEMVCCRRSIEMEMGPYNTRDDRVVLLDWAYKCYEEGRIGELVEDDEEASRQLSRVKRLIKVAIWCVQEEPSMRPTMHKVLQMMEGAVDVPPPPHPSSFLSSLA